MSDYPYVKMFAAFKILIKGDNGVYTSITKENISVLSLGSFTFKINEMDIPFDFNASSYNEAEGVFQWESGEGPFFRENYLCKDFDAQYKKLGISRTELVPKFLSSATGIIDFYINFETKEGSECEGGFCTNNLLNSIPVKVELLSIVFGDQDCHEYKVKDSVIRNYNHGIC